MGADYSSIAIIGIPVHEALFDGETRKEKAFAHDYPETTAFCPKTGRKLWTLVTERRPEYDEDKETFAGFKVIRGTDDHPVYLAVVVADGTYSNGGKETNFKALPLNLEELKLQLKALLEPLQYWQENEFGLYTILHCSY